MTAKLLKYDFKKTTKILIYMYIISIAIACVTRLVSLLDHIQLFFIITKVLESCVYAAVVNILVNTFIHILTNFIKGFYGDESYLTHTLPVGKEKLLLSKYLTTLIVILLSVLVCFLSLFIAIYNEEVKLFIELALNQSLVGFDMSVGGFIGLICGLLFVQTCANISIAFLAIVIANMFNSKRVIKGILVYFVIYEALSIVLLGVVAIVFAVTGNIGQFLAEVMSQDALVITIVVFIVGYAVGAVGLYFLCQKLFKKGVNVD